MRQNGTSCEASLIGLFETVSGDHRSIQVADDELMKSRKTVTVQWLFTQLHHQPWNQIQHQCQPWYSSSISVSVCKYFENWEAGLFGPFQKILIKVALKQPMPVSASGRYENNHHLIVLYLALIESALQHWQQLIRPRSTVQSKQFVLQCAGLWQSGMKWEAGLFGLFQELSKAWTNRVKSTPLVPGLNI